MLDAKHTREEKIKTGLLPKVSAMGTLKLTTVNNRDDNEFSYRGKASPEKVTESQNQNAHSGELHNSRQIGVECFDQIPEHWRQRQGPDTHNDITCHRNKDGGELPVLVPILVQGKHGRVSM
jgi:hypothetical protein